MAAVGMQSVCCNPAALICLPIASQLRAGRAWIATQRHTPCEPAGGSAGKRCNHSPSTASQLRARASALLRCWAALWAWSLLSACGPTDHPPTASAGCPKAGAGRGWTSGELGMASALVLARSASAVACDLLGHPPHAQNRRTHANVVTAPGAAPSETNLQQDLSWSRHAPPLLWPVAYAVILGSGA